MRNILGNKKGFQGLAILASVVTMLFIIGLLVMIYVLMGAELWEEGLDTLTSTYANSKNQTTFYPVNSDNATAIGLRNVREVKEGTWYMKARGWSLVNCTNGTDTTHIVPTTNYTWNSGNGTIILPKASGTTNCDGWNNTQINCSFSVTWDKNATASDVIYTTYTELSNTTDWFGVIIVISAMVVLILLTVIIIKNIRGSGIMGGASPGRGTPGAFGRGGREIGTA